MQDTHNESDVSGVAHGGASGIAAIAMRWFGAAVSLGLVVGIIYWVFALGQRDAQEVPVIRAMIGDARIIPENPEGSQVDNQGLAVNEVLANEEPTVISTNTTLAPETQSVDTEDSSMAVLQTPVLEPVPVPEITEPVRVDVSSALVEIIAPHVAADGMTLPVRRPDSISEADSISDTIEGLLQELQPEEEGDTSSDVPPLDRPQPLYGNPLLDPGAALVQLGAYNSVAEAANAWGRYQRVHGDLLGNLLRFIEPIEDGGRVLFRLRAAGLADLNQTRDLCAALEARDVDCISVTTR